MPIWFVIAGIVVFTIAYLDSRLNEEHGIYPVGNQFPKFVQ